MIKYNFIQDREFVPVVPERQIATEEVDHRFVQVISDKDSPKLEGSFKDFDIQVFIDAGLIDKLAQGKPVAASLLDRQDAIWNASELIQELHLDEQVLLRKQEIQAQLEAEKAAELAAKKEKSHEETVINNTKTN